MTSKEHTEGVIFGLEWAIDTTQKTGITVDVVEFKTILLERLRLACGNTKSKLEDHEEKTSNAV